MVWVSENNSHSQKKKNSWKWKDKRREPDILLLNTIGGRGWELLVLVVTGGLGRWLWLGTGERIFVWLCVCSDRVRGEDAKVACNKCGKCWYNPEKMGTVCVRCGGQANDYSTALNQHRTVSNNIGMGDVGASRGGASLICLLWIGNDGICALCMNVYTIQNEMVLAAVKRFTVAIKIKIGFIHGAKSSHTHGPWQILFFFFFRMMWALCFAAALRVWLCCVSEIGRGRRRFVSGVSEWVRGDLAMKI